MTDIEKALAMIAPSAFYEINPENVSILANAFKASIEQHEAFRQEVSDAAREYEEAGYCIGWEGFERFIIPAPKSDPLVSAMDELEWCNTDALAKDLRDTLDALGFEIREKSDD